MANTIVQVGTLRELENISLAPGDYEISMFLPVSLSQPQVESIRSGLASSNVQLLQPIRYDPTTNKLTIYARQPDLSGIAFGWSDITGGISNVLGGIISGNQLTNSFRAAGKAIHNENVTSPLTQIYGNVGWIDPGEIRTSSVPYVAANVAAIAASWHNPEAQDIYILKVVVKDANDATLAATAAMLLVLQMMQQGRIWGQSFSRRFHSTQLTRQYLTLG